MSVTAIEGVVKNGQIVLSENFSLPESAKVYVIVPSPPVGTARIMSPRLVDKGKLKDFEREIIEIENDQI